MVTPGGCSVVVDPQHTRLAMRLPNAPPGLPHHPVPGLRGTPSLYTNRHAGYSFIALLCGYPCQPPDHSQDRIRIRCMRLPVAHAGTHS